MGYTLTKEQTEIVTTDKQYTIVKGERRSGKTFTSFCLACMTITSEYVQNVYVILPTIRRVEIYIKDFLNFLGDYEGMVEHISRERLYISFRDKCRIQFFVPSDILRYQFRGYQKPDLIIIDDASTFEDKDIHRIFYAIKENYHLRNWNCKFYISYYPIRKIDKLQAFYKYTNHKYWFKKTLGESK